MDLSDILPLLILVGGALFSFVGKALKGDAGSEKKVAQPARRRRQTQLPPIVPQQQVEQDDWIPTNDPMPPLPQPQAAAMPQPWELEGGRSLPAEAEPSAKKRKKKAKSKREREAVPVGGSDPNYAITEADDAAVPQDWRKAIIAYEIMKSKF